MAEFTVIDGGKPNPQQVRLMADAALRKMQHAEWLRQFALHLQEPPPNRPPVPMTPFRAGAIGRLRLAADYVELIERETRDNERWIKALQLEIEDLKRMLRPEESR